VSVPGRIFALMLKELVTLLKDPRSRVVVILPPIIQTLVFGYAASFDLNDLAYAVYDQDRSAASRELLAHFRGSPHFREVAVLEDDDQIAPLVDARRVLLVVHVRRGFARDLLAGRPAPVQLVVDGRNSNTALVALGYANTIVNAFGQQWRTERSGAGPPADVVARAWFNPNLESRWFIVPGLIGLLTLLVTMMVTSLSVAREREQGTFDQLLVTPLRPVDILLGKALPGLVIGFGEATVMLGIVTLWFQVPLRGSLLTLYAGVAIFLLSAVGIGLMISSLSVTMQQGLLGAFLFMVPAILLSGFATPIANMPPWLQTLTLVNPLRYFLRVLRGTFLEGAPLALLWQQFWPMALIGVATLSVAAWLFRRRLY
jgi:ABC-2 type transport system permease protein